MSEISVVDTQTLRHERNNTWVTHVKLSDDKVVTGEAYDILNAVFDARQKVKEYLDSLAPKTEPNTLASDLSEQEKVMTGLIEKAKRANLDHRLIAMANTDFERGFMALEKAINTNKG